MIRYFARVTIFFVMRKLTKKENETILKLRGLFPSTIKVRVTRSADGGFFAEIINFPGCLTEADAFSELVDMINDCVKTYFDIPQKYISYMPDYLSPIKMAQHFGVFPVRRLTENLVLQINHE